MSWIDDNKGNASDNPNFFKIGDISLFVPIQNIDITRHENFQTISYLRDAHAMKINTGRSVLRVNITFPILVDRQLQQLQSLVAMTRVTPFVPIQNRFLQAQLRIYDTAPESFEIDSFSRTDPDSKIIENLRGDVGDLFSSNAEPTFLEALPMAIVGMSVTMGGDSPEIAECAMSFIYWNPIPWFGIDLQYWKNESLIGLNTDYNRYILNRVDDSIPSSFDTTIFRWWDIQLYSELTAKYTAELEQADLDAEAEDLQGDATRQREAFRADDDDIGNFTNFDNYAEYMANRINVDEFVEGIAVAEVREFDQEDTWSAINPTTNNAGRFQMSRQTFSEVFFHGSDTEDGVPARDKLRERPELVGNSEDPWVEELMQPAPQTLTYYQQNNSPFSSDEKFARWIARPEMAGVQTLVAQEYAKGLFKKHDNDAVAASLEYHLGRRDSRPYVATWQQHHIISDWKKEDQDTLAADNLSPRAYVNRMLGNFNEDRGGSVTMSNRPINVPGQPTTGRGPVPINRHGDLVGNIVKPVISEARRNKLRELGWEQISVLPNGKPNPDILNPLFARTAAHLIDLQAGAINSSENQVVTSITIAFQNRFASLPVQGWPYPALQHMGSVDSEIRMTIACLSDSQQYNRLKQAQHMMHKMATRARKYRADIHDGREILLISRLGCTNRLINALGIKNVVLTDMSVQVDPESVELARGELIMSESAFDPEKESLTASIGKNDIAFRTALREVWLGGERYLQSTNPLLRDMGVRLAKLQAANDAALNANMDLLFQTDEISEVVAHSFTFDDDFRDMTVFTREDESHYRKILAQIPGTLDPADQQGLKMKSAIYVRPLARVLNRLDQIPAEEFDRFSEITMPIDPKLLLTEGLSSKVGNWLENIYRGSNTSIPKDIRDIDDLKGSASSFLNTSFGRDMYEVWKEMNTTPTIRGFERLVAKFFTLWSSALHEWYNREIIEAILLFLYRTYENDSTFSEIATQARGRSGTGVYKDLFLDRAPELNPYSWLDESIIPKITEAIETVVENSEARLDRIVTEFNRMIRSSPSDADIIPGRHDASALRAQRDLSVNNQSSRNFGISSYKAGIQRTAENIGQDARKALKAMRYFSVVPFTMRRAFPAFRMYFLEEDNQGIFKRFDDFYNYNAITDIQMIKYKHRPATMIVTMTNMFGHLDAKTFDDMADRDDIAEYIRAAAADRGKLPTQVMERGPNGEEKTIAADGTESPLREIMLQPGTKIVMKLGYENDPDNLPTTFAGQVTEVSGGEVLTIVCQDWTSEMFAGAVSGDDYTVPTDPNWLAKRLGTSSTWDLQGTSSARTMLAAVLQNRSVQHFGHWQIGRNTHDPLFFGYLPESSLLLKPFDGQITKAFRIFTKEALQGRSRALINIHPEPVPFYTAFGIEMNSFFPEKDEIRQMSLWELVQMQRRLIPNHVALVRPYGQGDATLYFGPPWGVYQANDFNEAADEDLFDEILSKNHNQIFRELIRNDVTVQVSGKDYINSSIIGRKWKELTQDLTTGDVDSGVVEVTIAQLLMESAEVIAQTAGRSGRAATTGGGGLGGGDELVVFLGKLHSGAPDVVIDNWYETLLSTYDGGGVRDDEQRHGLLIDVQSAIVQAIRARLINKAISDPEFDKSGVIRKAIKPTRRWHVVNAQHHIIANNIVVNNNFSNEVRAGDTIVRYDPELQERRTRFADREIPESLVDNEVKLTFYLTSLLAEEMRNMYRGQLILTGNAEIEPHDIIMIFDDVRHIHGAIEVAKVQHIFSQEMGFITIIEPHLIVEQGDYSLSAALSSTIATLSADAWENEETRAGRLVNRAVFAGVAVGASLTNQFTGGIINPEFSINYIVSQMLVPREARNHPLTIFPLVKRRAPWIGGIDGASGRGVLGSLAQDFIAGLDKIRDATKVISKFEHIYDAGRDLIEPLKSTGRAGGLVADPKAENLR